MKDLEKYLVRPDCSVREAMVSIDRNAKGIVLVVDEKRKLLGTVSDGDVRRAILEGLDLNLSVQTLLDHRKGQGPVTALPDANEAELLRIMNERSVRQLPLVNEQGEVVRVAFLSDLIKELELPITAVIMAGGFGTRLRPLTEKIPKPMLPVGDRPLLERTIERLKSAGISQVSLTTHYKADVIAKHFGDGRDFGVHIDYVKEDQPLGTAGALSLLEESEGPLLVMNGDILTQVDFRAMLNFHRAHHAYLTVCVRQYDVQVPYGVVNCHGAHVSGVTEKPTMRFFVNAGIYLIESAAHRFVPKGQRFDMPDLIKCLLAEKRPVVSFPIMEYWLDIGKPVDYEKAQQDAKNGRLS